MFQYEQICSLNESEFSVYSYISRHQHEIGKMNIRELSAATGVSTTTILRFCSKFGCDGYKEFKYMLEKSLEKPKEQKVYFPSSVPAIQFLQHVANDKEIEKKMEMCADICMQARQVVFVGIGTSGSLGEYGARLLSSVGVMSFAITDPFYPMTMNTKDMQDMVLIALSVSGETAQTISLMDAFRKRNTKIISITNTNQCTAAKMSEINFSYYMPVSYVMPEISAVNLTTQIPVIYLLETLRHKIYVRKE